MIIELDSELMPVKDRTIFSQSALVDKLSDRQVDYRTMEVSQSLFSAMEDLAGDIFHLGYLSYLEHCWNTHAGVVLTPDIVWQTLLGELATIVCKSPQDHRHLFTRTEGKQAIIVPGTPDRPEWINEVMGHLRQLVPTNIDLFLPDFSTTTPLARLCRHGMFCQMVSPYYNYAIFCCGIPRVDVRGTTEDWALVRENWEKISPFFPQYVEFTDRAKMAVGDIADNLDGHDREFWQNMFYMVRCGSGSQQEAGGWFLSLFREHQNPGMTHNYPNGLARVDFYDCTGDKHYQSVLGILSSREYSEGGVREPLHGHVLFERRVVERSRYHPYNTVPGLQKV